MADIDKVMVALSTRLRRFKTEVGIEIKDRCEQRSPIGLTRQLINGWGFTLKQSDIEVYNTAPHASFVEYGTPKMAPRGMLRTTLLEINEIVKLAIERAKK